MLRKDKLLTLADHIEKMDQGSYYDGMSGFDMRVWHEDWCKTSYTGEKNCGTAACIGGTAEIIFDLGYANNVYKELSDAENVFESPDYNTLHSLFYPSEDGNSKVGWNATPTQAATVIRHLVETGKVDWTIIGPAPIKHPEEDLLRLADDGNPHAD